MRRLALLAAAASLAACSTRISVDDVPGRAVALGPLVLDGDALIVELAVWDHEGDAVDVELRWGTGVVADREAAAIAPYRLDALPADAGAETRHAVVWRFADDGVPFDAPITLSVAAADGLSPAVALRDVRLASLAASLPAPAAR